MICFRSFFFLLFLFPLTAHGSPKVPAYGSKWMVTSNHELASKAGIEILSQGGNVIDAAVGVSLVLCVVKPQSTGIAGGGFLLYHDTQKKKLHAFDFRERAPEKAHEKMFFKEGKVLSDHPLDIKAVGTPGLIAGLYEIQQRFGNLPFSQVIKPAIIFAEEGFPVDVNFYYAIKAKKDFIEKDNLLKSVFLPRGEIPKIGSLFIQEDLAQTLKSISLLGKKTFYEGRLARQMVEYIQTQQGLLTLSDFKNYKVKIRKPLEGKYRNLKIVTMPPPSAGGTQILQMLQILSHFPLEKLSTTEILHLLAESMRYSFYFRSKYMADPDYVKIPLQQILEPKFNEKLASTISLQRANKSEKISLPSFDSAGTIHFNIMDDQGNAVSSTQTINTFFGSLKMVPKTGMILNNEMADFATAPGAEDIYGVKTLGANKVEAGKTPVSSMSPTFVFHDGKIELAIGAPGGPYILTGILQTLIAHYALNFDLQKSVNWGRIHHQFLPDELKIEEKRFDLKVYEGLKEKGHRVVLAPHGARVNVIKRKNGRLIGVIDSRDFGMAVGK